MNFCFLPVSWPERAGHACEYMCTQQAASFSKRWIPSLYVWEWISVWVCMGVRIDASLDELPLLFRSGTIVPYHCHESWQVKLTWRSSCCRNEPMANYYCISYVCLCVYVFMCLLFTVAVDKIWFLARRVTNRFAIGFGNNAIGQTVAF